MQSLYAEIFNHIVIIIENNENLYFFFYIKLMFLIYHGNNFKMLMAKFSYFYKHSLKCDQ